MPTTHALLELVSRNFGWMLGNLVLAWGGLLVAWQLVGPPRRARIAAALMVGGLLLGAFVRMTDLQELLVPGGADIDFPSAQRLLVLPVLAAAAIAFCWRAQAGDRWTRWVGALVAVVFAPNAPYVLTDGMHYIQDLRFVQLEVSRSVIFAVVYGWFLVLGTTAWILLLDLARTHTPARRLPPAALPVLAAIPAAIAIYIGRIERIHSWHPLTDPVDFLTSISVIVTDPGPALFTVVWAAVVALVGWIGLWSLDRARRGTPELPTRTAVQVVTAFAWLVSGALLAGLPAVGVFDPQVGVDTAPATSRDAALALVAGVALATVGLRALRVLLRPADAPRELPYRGTWGEVGNTVGTVAAVVALGVVLVGGSTLGWWVQYRGLCEYGPTAPIHRETCR